MDLSEKKARCNYCGADKWDDNVKRNRHIVRDHPELVPGGIDLSDY